MTTPLDEQRWNHNIHYARSLLDAVPAGARTALDVGCGEGQLVRALARRVPQVTGLDPDSDSIAAARRQCVPAGVEFVEGDVLAPPFPDESFDVVTAVASLHPVDARAGLARLSALLRPGGLLGVVGLARNDGARDLGWEVAGAVLHRLHAVRHRGHWQHPSPIAWPPPDTYADLRALVAELLPGARFTRHAMWRYVVLWRKPTGGS